MKELSFSDVVYRNIFPFLALVYVYVSFALLLCFLASSTVSYQRIVRALWEAHYDTAAYILNWRDANLAKRMGDHYFSMIAYNLARAEATYALALRLDTHMPQAHYQLARVYFVEGKYAKALSEVNTELATNPTFFRSYYERGLIEISQKDLLAAEHDFQHFIFLAPKEWGGYNDLAFVLAKEGKYKESELVARSAFAAVDNAEEVSWLWNTLGVAQLNLGEYADAKFSFEKALSLAEQITVSAWYRAYSANDPQTAGESIANFKQAIKENIRATAIQLSTV